MTAIETYIGTVAAAKILGISASYMRKLRHHGGGPRFYKIGARVLYLESDLRAWAQTRSAKSTSEYDRQAAG